MPEELDLSDEEMAELMEFSRNYQDEETTQRLAMADGIKETDKAITETIRENAGGSKGYKV